MLSRLRKMVFDLRRRTRNARLSDSLRRAIRFARLMAVVQSPKGRKARK